MALGVKRVVRPTPTEAVCVLNAKTSASWASTRGTTTEMFQTSPRIPLQGNVSSVAFEQIGIGVRTAAALSNEC